MKCRNMCGFYGTDVNDGYCSQCAPKCVKERNYSGDKKGNLITNDNVCIVCGNKAKIHVIQCRCKQPLCKSHVSEDKHECTFDYKAHARDIIKKQNPKIAFDKLNARETL